MDVARSNTKWDPEVTGRRQIRTAVIAFLNDLEEDTELPKLN